MGTRTGIRTLVAARPSDPSASGGRSGMIRPACRAQLGLGPVLPVACLEGATRPALAASARAGRHVGRGVAARAVRSAGFAPRDGVNRPAERHVPPASRNAPQW
jgi:hypothetical protein